MVRGEGCQRIANVAVPGANRGRKLQRIVGTMNYNTLAEPQSKQEGQRRKGARAVEGGSKA
jgi:hypothetical protein